MPIPERQNQLPWRTDDWFAPVPYGSFAAFDGTGWRTATDIAQFQELLTQHPAARSGPFVLPGRDRLLSLWDLPGIAEAYWAALQRNVRKAITSSLNLTLILGGLAGAQHFHILKLDPGTGLYLWLFAILFGIMPLASALTERWQMSRPDFIRPGSLRELQFSAWQSRQSTTATYVIMTVLIAVYTATCLASSSAGRLELDPNGEVLLDWGMKVNPLIWQGQVWRLVTCIFLHANLVHIFFNTLALYQLGRVAEALLGSWRTLGLFLISGLVSSITSLVLSPHPSLGASGAVCGLLGVLVAFVWTGQAPGFLGRSVQSMVIGIMLLGFLASAYIDNAGHAGGLAAGIGLGWLYFHNRWPEAISPEV